VNYWLGGDEEEKVNEDGSYDQPGYFKMVDETDET